MHMMWECPHLVSYWVDITDILKEITLREIPCTPAYCLLHWFPRSIKYKVTSRFIDLALILAKREITRNWKARTGTTVLLRKREFIRWADCEGAGLMREAKMGRGNIDMARAWEALLEELKFPDDPEGGGMEHEQAKGN